MPPTAPAAPVTRIGLSCLCFVVMSLTLGYAQKTDSRRLIGASEATDSASYWLRLTLRKGGLTSALGQKRTCAVHPRMSAKCQKPTERRRVLRFKA